MQSKAETSPRTLTLSLATCDATKEQTSKCFGLLKIGYLLVKNEKGNIPNEPTESPRNICSLGFVALNYIASFQISRLSEEKKMKVKNPNELSELQKCKTAWSFIFLQFNLSVV